MTNVRDTIRRLVFGKLFLLPQQSWPSDEADLFALGLDSLRVLELLLLIEEQLRVKLPDHEVAEERLASVAALTAWVESQPQR